MIKTIVLKVLVAEVYFQRYRYLERLTTLMWSLLASSTEIWLCMQQPCLQVIAVYLSECS